MVPSKGKRIAGWILSGIVAAFLIGASGVPKFVDFPGKTEMFEKMGFTVELMYKIGALEIALAILYLIPRTAFIATILLTGYLGGAVVTHVRVGEPFVFPVITGILAWIGCGLRIPTIFSLSLGKQG